MTKSKCYTSVLIVSLTTASLWAVKKRANCRHNLLAGCTVTFSRAVHDRSVDRKFALLLAVIILSSSLYIITRTSIGPSLASFFFSLYARTIPVLYNDTPSSSYLLFGCHLYRFIVLQSSEPLLTHERATAARSVVSLNYQLSVNCAIGGCALACSSLGNKTAFISHLPSSYSTLQ